MYASTIWRPIGKINMNRLEKIQHNVLRHLAYLSGNPLSRYDHDYTSTAETFRLASVTSSMIASDVIIVYKIKSNHVKCPDLQNLFPIHNSNYVLRNRLHFYPKLPSSRHSEANPIFRLSRFYEDLSQELENPLDFSLNISKFTVLFKMLTLVYK